MRFRGFCYAGLLFGNILVSSCSSSGHPSENQLAKEFREFRSFHERLADKAANETGFSRISYDFTHPDWSLPESERKERLDKASWDEYRSLFKALNLESGVTKYDDGQVIVLERSSSGLVTAGSSVGFIRAAEIPEGVKLLPIDAKFDCNIDAQGSCLVAKNIYPGWYLILEKH